MAIGIGTPLGIAAGTWLAEYGAASKIGTVVRFVNDILLSAPSIVLGLFVYTLLVMQAGGNFSAVAGAVSLAFIVLPVVLRTTDEMLRLVPAPMREAAPPLGSAAGSGLAESGGASKIGTGGRCVNVILLSAPSFVLGLFVYTLLWMQAGGNFSAVAGAVSLAFIVLPVVLRTTDEMLRLVPAQMREAALSLGVPQWKVIVQVMYRSAMPGIVTGILLALARISGETAPLLFTAFGNQYWRSEEHTSEL